MRSNSSWARMWIIGGGNRLVAPGSIPWSSGRSASIRRCGRRKRRCARRRRWSTRSRATSGRASARTTTSSVRSCRATPRATTAPGVQGNGQDLVPSGPAQPLIYNFQTAQLTVGFVPDVFGEQPAQGRVAGCAGAEYSASSSRRLTSRLASNVVAAAIQEARDRAQLKAAVKEIIAHQREITRRSCATSSSSGYASEWM